MQGYSNSCIQVCGGHTHLGANECVLRLWQGFANLPCGVGALLLEPEDGPLGCGGENTMKHGEWTAIERERQG